MTTRPSPLLHVHPDREGVPLEPTLRTAGIATGSLAAILALFLTVLGVIY